MKVLWLANTSLPVIAGDKIRTASWIWAIYNEFIKKTDVSLIYLYPAYSIEDRKQEQTIDNATFISFRFQNEIVNSQIVEFKSIIERESPDVINIFGTEYVHTFAMVKACDELGVSDKIVITIQGLVSIYSKHYTGFLPENIVNGHSFYDFVKKAGIRRGQRKFEQVGKLEEEAIKSVKHIIGRTDWDKACVKRLNPTVNYHYCSETMRKPFYKNNWNYENCEKHSIFLSQAHYPIKGLHLVIEAIVDLIKKYPDIHLYTTGDSFLVDSFHVKIRLTKYKQYCKKLIKDAGLEDHITFLGCLDENEMCERFLKSNVFVCASSIENSPNSLGEATLLGVPTVSSDVGGVKNLLVHNEEGLIYPADEPYMLAYYVSEIFENQKLAEKFSENSKEHAGKLYDLRKNVDDLFAIYNKIIDEK